MAGIKDVIETLDKAADGFESTVSKTQKKLYEDIIVLVKELDLDGLGKVKPSVANFKKLTAIKTKLSHLAKETEYSAGIGKFLQYFDVLQQEQNAYFTGAFPQSTVSITAAEKHKLMKQIAVQNTIEALTGTGLKANVTDKINDILLRAVTSGAKFADLTSELKGFLEGEKGSQGALSRYATTYATTALSQFTGQNNKLLTQDLKNEWFMYVGSTKETTREFCEHLVEKRYIHKSEIPTILKGEIDGHQCKIYDKTGLPLGMIEGTNEENFQVNCGGWNCRHQLVPVDELAVPQDVRDKIKNTYKQIKPTVEKKVPDIKTKDYNKFLLDLGIEDYMVDRAKEIGLELGNFDFSNKDEFKKQVEASVLSREREILKQRQLIDDCRAILVRDYKCFNVSLELHKVSDEAFDGISDTASFNQRVDFLKKKVAYAKNVISYLKNGGVVPLKEKYENIDQVKDTLSLVGLKTKWFANGGLSMIVEESNPDNNGSTDGNGTIWLNKERMEKCVSLFDKVSKGEVKNITLEEADAVSTLWHEITHNSHDNSIDGGDAGSEDSVERKYMELTNEWVSRHTLADFYSQLGISVPYPILENNRLSTAYNGMTKCFDIILSKFKISIEDIMPHVKDKLFKGRYNNLKNGLYEALILCGAKDYVYGDDIKNPTKITGADIIYLVNMCVTGFSLGLIDYIDSDYPNLRKI